jgi:Type I restriction enzyme R protein N terminus (HSDR_N)
MTSLNLPTFDHQLTEQGGKSYIFDVLRRKYVRLTPEEWVRQHLIHLLINNYQYPKSLMHCEGGLTLNQTQKRTDLVIFDRAGQPFLVAECKAPTVAISQAVFDQVERYNHVHQAPYWIVSNGLDHFCAAINQETAEWRFLDDFPAYLGAGI